MRPYPELTKNKLHNLFCAIPGLPPIKRPIKINITPRGPQGALPQERSGARSPVLEEYIDFSPSFYLQNSYIV